MLQVIGTIIVEILFVQLIRKFNAERVILNYARLTVTNSLTPMDHTNFTHIIP